MFVPMVALTAIVLVPSSAVNEDVVSLDVVAVIVAVSSARTSMSPLAVADVLRR